LAAQRYAFNPYPAPSIPQTQYGEGERDRFQRRPGNPGAEVAGGSDGSPPSFTILGHYPNRSQANVYPTALPFGYPPNVLQQRTGMAEFAVRPRVLGTVREQFDREDWKYMASGQAANLAAFPMPP
jgi:hypothetical protein